MLNNKRIVIIHPGNPKFDYRLKKTAEGLTAAGAEVIVVAYLSQPENNIQDWNCISKCRPRPYTMVKASNNRIWLLRVLWNLSIVRLQSMLERRVDECEGLYKIALQYKPDLLYFINIESVEEAYKAVKSSGNIPIVYEAYEYYPSLLRDNLYFSDVRRNRKLRKLEQAVCSSQKVTAIVVGEDISRGYHEQYGCKLPVVVHNVAPKVLEKLPDHGGVITFCFQSYLRPTYNIEQLIDAFARVEGNAQLVIQGNAHEEGYFDFLKSYIESKGSNSKITLLSACPYESVVEVASKHDVGLITISATTPGKPSENVMLALPNKLFTYMSAGLAIVAADYPAQSNIISESGCGVVFEPDNYDSLTAVMQNIVDHPDDVYAMREASLRMGQKFSLKNEMNKLYKICLEAIMRAKEEK